MEEGGDNMPTPTPVTMVGFTQNLTEGSSFFLDQIGGVITTMQTNVVLLFFVGLMAVGIIISLLLKIKHGI